MVRGRIRFRASVSTPVKATEAMENRTARLTILIDPEKKRIFEEICAGRDLTPSQVVRQMIRQYIVENAGNRELPDWLTANVPRPD
jgi:hypothetical protein